MSPGSRKVAEVELSSGDVFADRYQVEQRLGAGSAAVVYKARDLAAGRTVALKLIRPALSQNRRVVAQYQRDLETARQLNHESLVGILAASERDGIVYVALEFVEGITLEEWRRRRSRIPAAEFLPLFRQLCAAVARLHSKDLIHGDISAWHVLVTAAGRVKLMEFGIVRDLRQETTGDPNRSTRYRAPEQLLGRTVTTAADVYSLGILAFELLTGKTVHAGLGLAQRCTAPPPSLRSEAAEASPALARIIERCLEPDAGQRFPNAGSLETAVAELGEAAPASEPLVGLPAGKTASPQFVIGFLGSVCSRLREIHAAGLSHPDLSPKTLFASEAGAVDLPARPAPPPSATVLITEPKYAAPEQLLGRTAPDDPSHVAADIYVLGFIAYEMLAGQQEFQRQFQHAISGDLGWMNWHADTARRLRPFAEFMPECPAALSQLLERMTEKDSTQRVATLEEVQAVLTELSPLFETTAELALGPELPPAPPPAPRRRFGLIAGVSTAVLALGLAAWWLWSTGAFHRLLPAMAAWRSAITGRVATHGGKDLRSPAPIIETSTGRMLLVPGGEFTMGNDTVPNQTPAHSVRLPSFYMDRFEVTNALYRKFCDREQRAYPPAPAWDAAYFSKPDHPALNIRWSGARDFCADAGKRLPSEAEWERAARGGATSSAQWANWVVPGFANLKDSGPGVPAAVGAFPFDLSPDGIYDLAGNVHEWVADDYHLYAGNAADSAATEAGRKTVRGGSFALRPPNLSPSWRASLAPDLVAGQDLPVGFRCAADIDAEAVRGAR